MLRFKIILLLLFFFYGFAVSQENQPVPEKKTEKVYTPEEIKQLEEDYRLALQMYRRGSYYTALNVLSKLVRDRNNPFYGKALFLMAKIYLHLGRKTGLKEFIQKAMYYLNTYSYSVENPFDWEFYYTKGNIYENLYMYERALAMYKKAFSMADTPKKQFKTVVAILRVAAWLKRMDIITRYIILVNLSELSEKEKKEFEFVKGLVEFEKGNYKEAIKYLIPVYKTYEEYLIENPDYYLIVGENAYRLGDYSFAKKIFKRIISIVKDESVIRKALLRLGDIALKEGDKILAMNYYYEVVKKYPDTDEAVIAKLKLIALGKRDRDIQIRLLTSEDKDFKDPLGFILKALVLNRNNYVGFFALADFGFMVLGSKSEKLFDKLVHELSLVNISRMKYEHIEYIRELWEPELYRLNYMRVCKLFSSNEKFFYTVFDRKMLEHFYSNLKKCGKLKMAFDIANFLYNKWKDDRAVLLLADAYYSLEKYKKSVEILKKIKNKNCQYYILLSKNYIFLKKADISLIDRIKNRCKKESVEKRVVISYLFLENGQVEKAFKTVEPVTDKLPDYYTKTVIGKMFIRKIVYLLFEKELYQQALKILIPLSERLKKDCDINSWVLVAAVRTDMEKLIEKYRQRIQQCNTEWSLIAKNIYEDYQVIRGLKNE
ncbi:Tetratricopeptide repeat-containing protein [Persephonella hydrogeniphila]|uniref:Tetratricopeptide repeat-containing protein n=1 Tax=Persephonella hydrogeniphila TaxID=198703 RepID=A0A285NF68_9AQUI|nr:Tetratricopeptide repeat-containing protein [Persephonella hydrogeniphila]